MFTLNCTKRAKTPNELAMLRRYLTAHSPGGYQFDTGCGAYWPLFLDTVDPGRLKHIEQVKDFHDAMFPECAAEAPRPVEWREPRPRDLSDEELRAITDAALSAPRL